MVTLDTVEDTLRKFEIDRQTLLQWERELQLSIPVDEAGNKQYSQHHINLFKNIKKHLALGRTMSQIRDTISLPPLSASKPSQPRFDSPEVSTNVASSALSEALPELQDFDFEQDVAISSASSTKTVPSQTKPFATAPSANNGSRNASLSSNQTKPQAADISEQPLVPPAATSKPEQTTSPVSRSIQAPATQAPSSAIRTNEPAPMAPYAISQPQTLQLVERLLNEKELINKKLLEAEKLNSHLYNVNNLFHRKVKELSSLVVKLKASNREEISMKLMDDKAKLHRQLLEADKARQDLQRSFDNERNLALQLKSDLSTAQSSLDKLTRQFDANQFIGRWQEEATLVQVVFDNFGINVEQSRQQERVIKAAPQRCFSNCAIISSQFEYESNPLWRRQETATIAYLINGNDELVGDLQVDYLLDGAPVARCLYRIAARRIG